MNLSKEFFGFSVIIIAANAFSYCTKLMSVSIPNTITSIENDTFRACSNLTGIVIPNSVTSIGDNAFAASPSIKYIYYSGSIDNWNSIKIGTGNDFLLNGSIQYDSQVEEFLLVDNEKYKYGKTDTNDITFIECKDKKIASIDFENEFAGFNVSIEESAFIYCDKLASVNFGNCVSSIGNRAFIYCNGLVNITIPTNVKSIGDSAFYNCKGLTNVVIEEGVKRIGGYAFASGTNLTTVTIANSVDYIGDSAFYDCNVLTINCEAQSKPTGWVETWNPNNRPVSWGYKKAN